MAAVPEPRTCSPWRAFVDSTLEATVVLSWSRVGPLLRRRLWGGSDEQASLEGQRIVVTGGTRGIGRAAAVELAHRGATITIVGRNRARAAQVAEVVAKEAGGGAVRGEGADLSSLAGVRQLAQRIAGGNDRLDAVIHNAGGLNRFYVESPEGLEMTFATHVVGPHLLTAELRGLLARTARARVVFMSSGGMYMVRLDLKAMLGGPATYRPAAAYARAKRAQVALAVMWAHRLRPDSVAVYVMHPGWVATEGLRHGLPRFAALASPGLRSPAEGADTAVWLASGRAPADAPVGFWLDRRARPAHLPLLADPPGEAERLFAFCEAQTGVAPLRGAP